MFVIGICSWDSGDRAAPRKEHDPQQFSSLSPNTLEFKTILLLTFSPILLTDWHGKGTWVKILSVWRWQMFLILNKIYRPFQGTKCMQLLITRKLLTNFSWLHFGAHDPRAAPFETRTYGSIRYLSVSVSVWLQPQATAVSMSGPARLSCLVLLALVAATRVKSSTDTAASITTSSTGYSTSSRTWTRYHRTSPDSLTTTKPTPALQ